MNQTRPDTTGTPTSRRDRRPRRSVADRKIAGVAGGLGRALGIDPIVLRVTFVVLTVFGGFGGLLYVLGWLFLPDERDEVSAAESLIGRGRSSVSPVLTVGLALIAVIGGLSTFSWGAPFLPIVILAVIVGFVMNRKRRHSAPPPPVYPTAAPEWQQRAQVWGEQAGTQAQRFAGRVEGWGKQAEEWVNRQPWAGGSGQKPAAPVQPSPFGDPAFWDQPVTPGAAAPAQPTPPAWDPLGVAPFAWDLPEPGPAHPAPVVKTKDRRVAARVTLGLALLGGTLVTAGIIAGWWALPWAFVTGVALAVVGLGLVLTSFVGRGRSLIGPGIFLSIATLVLGFTGLAGTDGFGRQVWQPTSVSELQDTYVLNAGQGNLDLSKLVIPTGTTQRVTLEVRAGHGEVLVPAGTAVQASCSLRAGSLDCLGIELDGVGESTTAEVAGAENRGTLEVVLDVRAGRGEVNTGV